ncbi:hypothetical protein E2C01_066128 [Portunus trituberculatus]|uniref:Uncharacterized protein n=1 Tax=Portunus trituberculatus TaxID=210409 RepID=A0A5B7HT16_PORTR|nr:hypothetical protein [Portunus trituberculatus]
MSDEGSNKGREKINSPLNCVTAATNSMITVTLVWWVGENGRAARNGCNARLPELRSIFLVDLSLKKSRQYFGFDSVYRLNERMIGGSR